MEGEDTDGTPTQAATSRLGRFLSDGRRCLAAGLLVGLLCFLINLAMAWLWPNNFYPWPQLGLLISGFVTYLGIPVATGLIAAGVLRLR